MLPDDCLSIIEICDSVDELCAIREAVDEETVILRGKDTGGNQGMMNCDTVYAKL
jgi:hypothetical protein